MGNAIAKKFNLPKEHTATAGHVCNWKIWPGKSKDNAGQLVSIWAFDKSDLTKRKLNPVADKAIVEQVFQIMKRDFTVIKDSKACSNIVQILEIVEDSKTGIAFTTERIVCSLADILNNFSNVPGGAAEHTNFFESGGAVSEMEISRGLLNIALAIQYLHTVQRKLHLNVTPENIVITATGQWKLCGFGFSLAFIQGETQRLASPYFMQAYPPATTSLVSRLEPDLRYAAPECSDGGLNPPGVRYLTPVADVFSLGLVFYELYRFSLKFGGADRNHAPLVCVTNNDAQQHHHALSTLQGVDFGFLPSGVVTLVAGMMQMNMQLRSTTADIVSNSYFVTGTQAVLNMVESMHTRDLGTQSSQLLSLQPELCKFPGRMLIHCILPAVSRLCAAAPNLWVYAMPLHAELSKLLPEDKYMYFAGPYLAQGLTTPELPNESIQVFLASTEFLCRTFGSEFFQNNVATLFCTALEKPNLYLQNLALEKLAESYVYTLFTAQTLVEKMVPQLCKQACKNPEAAVKIQALYVISLVTWKLDESYIAANVLTSLKYITDNEKNPAVSMSVVGNFESISSSLGLQYVATSILPILQGMLLDTGLDKQQFEMVVNMIKRLLKKILDKRTKELGIPPISVAEIDGSEMVDPFSNAKALIQQSRDKNIANNYGMVAGSYKAFGGDRQFSANNTSANSAYTITAPTKPASAAVVPTVENFHAPVELGPPTATYGATALGVTAVGSTPALSVPSKTPPPLPSAPPPSHAPPPVPAPSVVQGFGSQVTSTVGLPSSSSSYGSASLAQSLGSSSSSNGTPAAGGLTGLACSGSAPAQNQPTISAYQSSFSAPSSASSVASANSYGTPLTPLDSGLPGFGGNLSFSTTAAGTTGVPSVYNGSALTAAPAAAVTGFGNTPAPVEEPKKRSSWWSSSKPKTGTGNKESLMDAPAGDLYQPPVIPGASYTSNSYGASGGITAAPDDLDDFLSSFGKSAASSTMGASAGKPAVAATGASFSAAPAPTFRSSFGASTGSYNPTTVSPAPSVSSASTGAASGLSIEQQIAAAQAEIARLSASQQQAPVQSARPSQSATQHFGYGAQPAAGMMGGGYGQHGQQQGYYGNPGVATSYAAPQAGAMAGQYGYSNPQQGSSSAYQPPMSTTGYYNQQAAAPAAATTSKNTVSDAFDFLN